MSEDFNFISVSCGSMGTVSIYSNPPGGTKARAASYAMKGAQHRDRLAAEKAGLKWIPGMGPEEVALKAKVAAERRGETSELIKAQEVRHCVAREREKRRELERESKCLVLR